MPRAEIATHQAKHTLELLHAELGGKIKDNKTEAKRLAGQMKHVEAVLKLLDPAYSCRGISIRRRKPNPWFKRGTVWRAVLDVLRTARVAMTAPEITAAMLRAKGLQERGTKAVRDLEGAVRAALKNHEGDGLECSGMPVRWKVGLLPP